MTLVQFSQVYALLAVQLRHAETDVATVKAYYTALKDLEPEFVAMAAERFGKGAALNDQGEAWFPKAPEWRAMAARVELDRTKALSARLRKLTTPLCLACGDTSWRPSTRQADRFEPCDCRPLRRLEVLGRRPMPELTSGDVA